MKFATLLFITSVFWGTDLIAAPKVAAGVSHQDPIEEYGDNSRALRRALGTPPSKPDVVNDMVDLGAHICAPLFRGAKFPLSAVLKEHGFIAPGHREYFEFAGSTDYTFEREGGSMKLYIKADTKQVYDCKVWSPVHDLLPLFGSKMKRFMAASGMPLQIEPQFGNFWVSGETLVKWGSEPSGATVFMLSRN